ncbi:MAG: hypothetical protein JWQ09_4791 [Segetibacter sp.]|nr:hypothetical protein [Segetibacter sp.]
MKNIITYISCFYLLFTLTGCGKYLDKEPDNRAKLNTPEKVAQLLGTAYPQANYTAFAETSSDNVGDLGSGDAGSADLNTINADAYFFRDTRAVNEDTPEFYWFACYKAIAASNEALQTIKDATNPDQYKAHKGEALLARAYAHFMLVNFFSKFYDPATASSDPGIPYVTEPETVFIKQYDRKTVQYVYDMIEKDLTEGLPLIDDKLYRIPKYHFTLVAANAFASRFYLFKKDYPKVIQYASAAVPGNNFQPYLRPWNTIYRDIGFNEIKLRYAKATENANLLLTETRSYWWRLNSFGRYGMTPPIRSAVLRTVPVAGGSWAMPVGYYVENHDVVPKIDEYFVRVTVNAEIGDGYVMVPLFTAEEALFNLAEAYAYTGRSTEAITLLNTYLSTRILPYNAASNTITAQKINNYYGTSDIREGLVRTLLDYRRSEFIHEGLRWFDILRYKLTVTHTTSNGQTLTLNSNDPRRVFQIPPTVVQSGVQQNAR